MYDKRKRFCANAVPTDFALVERKFIQLKPIPPA